MAFHDVLQDIPYDGLLAVDDLLGALDSLHDTALDELAYDEGLVELGCHIFGDTALVHLQFGAYDDDRAGRVVDTLAEQILTEAALLALERVAQRLEGAVGVALDCRRLARVVEQRVDGLLQHTLLVAENHVGGLDLDETLQTVVADDDAAVEVVEVRCGESAAVEGTQLRGDDGHGLEYHPLGLVAVARCAEALDHLQALECLGLALLAAVLVGLVAQRVRQLVEVDVLEQVIDGLGAHLGDKLVGIVVLEALVVLGQLVEDVEVLFLGEEVETLHSLGHAGVDDDIALVVDHRVELLGGKTEQITYLVGQRAEVPDVCDGHDELDVAHALATHFFLGDFDTAAVTHDALVADALVLAAVALVVLDRTEDALAEEAVALGLVCAVVDGLGLEHLAARLFQDFLRRSEADADLGEDVLGFVVFSKSHI